MTSKILLRREVKNGFRTNKVLCSETHVRTELVPFTYPSATRQFRRPCRSVYLSCRYLDVLLNQLMASRCSCRLFRSPKCRRNAHVPIRHNTTFASPPRKNWPNDVTIVEVGPRDGLQNEVAVISTDVKVGGRKASLYHSEDFLLPAAKSFQFMLFPICCFLGACVLGLDTTSNRAPVE